MVWALLRSPTLSHARSAFSLISTMNEVFRNPHLLDGLDHRSPRLLSILRHVAADFNATHVFGMHAVPRGF
jgi:hypothetical protein